jgi:hypothetical protein
MRGHGFAQFTAVLAFLVLDNAPSGTCRVEDHDRTDQGVVSFAASLGHLKSSWADIPEKDRKRPDVIFVRTQSPLRGRR